MAIIPTLLLVNHHVGYHYPVVRFIERSISVHDHATILLGCPSSDEPEACWDGTTGADAQVDFPPSLVNGGVAVPWPRHLPVARMGQGQPVG